jgi:hypothetical protein
VVPLLAFMLRGEKGLMGSFRGFGILVDRTAVRTYEMTWAIRRASEESRRLPDGFEG